MLDLRNIYFFPNEVDAWSKSRHAKKVSVHVTSLGKLASGREWKK